MLFQTYKYLHTKILIFHIDYICCIQSFSIKDYCGRYTSEKKSYKRYTFAKQKRGEEQTDRYRFKNLHEMYLYEKNHIKSYKSVSISHVCMDGWITKQSLIILALE